MAWLFRVPHPRSALSKYHRASFSTSARCPASLQWRNNDQEALSDTLPPYPYGSAQWYKQSNLGLYGGQRIQFGNNVGDKIEVKTRRSWKPNVLNQRLWSNSLQTFVQVRVTTRTLRTIDKLGGLDNYLLGSKAARIKELGESGWWLRWAIMQTPAIKKRFAEERAGILATEGVEQLATESDVQVEQPSNSSPLKFRVGHRHHIHLTSSGWRRAGASRKPVPRETLRQRMTEEIKKVLSSRSFKFEQLLESTAKRDGLSETVKERVRTVGLEQLRQDCKRLAKKRWSEYESLEHGEVIDTNAFKREQRKEKRRALRMKTESSKLEKEEEIGVTA